MDLGAAGRLDAWAPDEDQRSARRYTSLIRAAKLLTMHGEFVCVIRDVSSGGISLRGFHRLPEDETATIELQNGETFDMRLVRGDGMEASYSFRTPVAVERLINESWNFPKRQLRLNISIPITVRPTLQKTGYDAISLNVSQQGACIECDTKLSIDQPVMLSAGSMNEARARVRWRSDKQYGVVLDDTFTLREFALLAARVQCPVLLEDR